MYTYLVVTVATITTKARYHPPPRRNESGVIFRSLWWKCTRKNQCFCKLNDCSVGVGRSAAGDVRKSFHFNIDLCMPQASIYLCPWANGARRTVWPGHGSLLYNNRASYRLYGYPVILRRYKSSKGNWFSKRGRYFFKRLAYRLSTPVRANIIIQKSN